MNEFFDLVRPIIEFKFEIVLARSNNIFEVMTNEPIDVLLKAGGKEVGRGGSDSKDVVEKEAEEELLDLMGEESDRSLHLKGQMNYMPEWNVIMFLSSPSLTDLESLSNCGLYINDLPMHDFSRDILLVGNY